MLATKNDLKDVITLFFHDSSVERAHGTNIQNFDALQLSTLLVPAGIVYNYKQFGEDAGWALASQTAGAIVFGQVTNGMIGVSLHPSVVELPVDEVKKEYSVTTEAGRKRKYQITYKKDRDKKAHYIYGIYEPWQLTDKKVEQIIARGLRFLVETRPNSEKRSFYTNWLLYKGNVLYQGIAIGIISSSLVAVGVELIKWGWELIHKSLAFAI